MTTEELVKHMNALPEKERIECFKSILTLSEVYEKIDSLIEQESAEDRQNRSKVSEHDYENKYRVSEEVMSLPFNM
jgi:hypothetical protein